MRKTMWALSAAALMVMTGAPAMVMAEGAAHKAKAGKVEKAAAKPKLNGELATIAKSADLTAEQTSAIEALAQEQAQALKEWTAANKEAADKAKADAASEDAETKKAGRAAQAKLSKERAAIAAQYTDKALAQLSPEQRGKYETAKIAGSIQMTLTKSKITLSDEQKAAVQAAAAASLKGVDASNAAAVRKASGQALEKVKSDVLTEDQRAQLPAPKAKAAKK